MVEWIILLPHQTSSRVTQSYNCELSFFSKIEMSYVDSQRAFLYHLLNFRKYLVRESFRKILSPFFRTLIAWVLRICLFWGLPTFSSDPLFNMFCPLFRLSSSSILSKFFLSLLYCSLCEFKCHIKVLKNILNSNLF